MSLNEVELSEDFLSHYLKSTRAVICWVQTRLVVDPVTPVSFIDIKGRLNLNEIVLKIKLSCWLMLACNVLNVYNHVTLFLI